MNAVKAFGYFLMGFSVFGAVFYVLWWGGAVPFLHRDDAVRLTALIVALAIFLAIGFVGYVTVSTKPPKPLQHENKQSQTLEARYSQPFSKLPTTTT